MIAISLGSIDLHVIFHRMDQAARHQEELEQQGQLRHQLALAEQKQLSHKEQQVQMSPRGEGSWLLPRQKRDGCRSRYVLKRSKSRVRSGRGRDLARGSRLDIKI